MNANESFSLRITNKGEVWEVRQKDGWDMSLETQTEYSIIVCQKHKQNFLFDTNIWK